MEKYALELFSPEEKFDFDMLLSVLRIYFIHI